MATRAHRPSTLAGATLAAILRRFGAGFAEIKMTPVSFRLKIPSAVRFAQGLMFGNPLFEEIGNRGGDPSAVQDAIADAIEAQLGPDMPLRTLVVEARWN